MLLFGCASWTLTASMEQQLRTVQRKMVRKMLRAHRLPNEEWVEYIKRTTASAENKMSELGYADWVSSFKRRKWRFAARIARAVDNRWSKRLFDWYPHFRCHPHRSVGRPLAHWHDGFVKLAGGDWPAIAKQDLWELSEDAFVEASC